MNLDNRVRDYLAGLPQDDGVEVAAFLRGELVVDVGTGTPVFSYSTGKGLTATIVHVLAEQGRVDYDLRIADVWPEYAAHGKGATTLRHALTHTAGVPQLPPDIQPEDFGDWQRMCSLIANAEPLWEPGTRQGYHAWTFGWLIGEVVRRVTGWMPSQALVELVSGPLGVVDELYFGVPADQRHRVPPLRDRHLAAALAAMAEQVPHFDVVAPAAVRPSAALANRPDILGADIPAGGTVSARAMARLYAALIDEVDGIRLISPERLALISTVATSGDDWTFDSPGPKTLGYAIEGPMVGWSGTGGSTAGAVPEIGLALAITTQTLAYDADDPLDRLRDLIIDWVTP
jgi:CubicO group peptidase (beta-lactamase class C family)